MRQLSNNVLQSTIERDTMNRFHAPIAAAILLISLPVSAAAESYGDEHCFTRSATGSVQPGDVVKFQDDGPLLDRDEGQLLAERVWGIRLGQHNWLRLDRSYLDQFESARLGPETGVPPVAQRMIDLDAAAVQLNEIHAEHMSRRNGSRHIYIAPALRRLARERAAVRQAQGRDCNPHITYLG